MSLANYTAAVLAATPKAYWELDEPSGNFADSSGGGFTLTPDSGPLYTQPGFFAPGSALFPIGASASAAVFSTAVDNWTVEMLVYVGPQYSTGFDWLYSCGTPAASNGFAVGIDSNGKLMGVAHNIGLTTAGATALPLNSWSHVAWRRAATVWTYLINGLSETAGSTLTPAAPSGTAYLNRTATGTNSRAWRIAHAALYETALSDYVVRAHAGAANAFSDLSGPLNNRLTSSSRRSRW